MHREHEYKHLADNARKRGGEEQNAQFRAAAAQCPARGAERDYVDLPEQEPARDEGRLLRQREGRPRAYDAPSSLAGAWRWNAWEGDPARRNGALDCLSPAPGSKTIAAMHSRCPLWVISGHFGMESGYPASIGRCAIEVEVADHIVAVAPVELLISFK